MNRILKGLSKATIAVALLGTVAMTNLNQPLTVQAAKKKAKKVTKKKAAKVATKKTAKKKTSKKVVKKSTSKKTTKKLAKTTTNKAVKKSPAKKSPKKEKAVKQVFTINPKASIKEYSSK